MGPLAGATAVDGGVEEPDSHAAVTAALEYLERMCCFQESDVALRGPRRGGGKGFMY